MVPRMGRTLYDTTDALRMRRPRPEQGSRAESCDRSVRSPCSARSEQSTTGQQSTAEQGVVRRNLKFLKDSYYYQR